jgi:hypothetical protein
MSLRMFTVFENSSPQSGRVFVELDDDGKYRIGVQGPNGYPTLIAFLEPDQWELFKRHVNEMG